MYCQECGTKNPDGAIFCMKCGLKIPIITHLNSEGDIIDDNEVVQQKMKNVPSHLTSKWDRINNGNLQQIKKVPSHLTNTWDLIDDDEAINKMRKSSQYFVLSVPVITEEAPEKIIRTDPATRAGATLLGGFLFGTVGALAGYAATGTKVTQKGSIKKSERQKIGFDVSVHKNGIKMIKMNDKSNIFKIPWERIIAVSHGKNSITLTSLNQDKLKLKGDITALKGLYLITKESMTGLIEKDEGWK